MNKMILSIFLMCTAIPFLSAQQLCYPPPADNPFDAPIIECLDGYQWATELPTAPNFEPPLFCGDINNPQWIAFVAQSDFMQFSLNLNGCIQNEGLQLAVYSMLEPCSEFNLILMDCFTTPTGNPANPFVSANGLEEGRVYYLLIDGWRGDQCGYEVDVVPDLIYPSQNPYLSGPASVLSGSTHTYSLTNSPCDSNSMIEPGDSCANAPLLCGLQLNGLCASNYQATRDQPGNLSAVSNCLITNNQYIRFIADEGEVQLVIATSNCQLNRGLELSVFSVENCDNFVPFANCLPLQDGGLDTVTISGLESCEEYYLMIDGQTGDLCDYQIFVQSGISTEPLMLNEVSPGCIEGPSPICLGDIVNYTFTPPVCEYVGGGNCSGGDFFNPVTDSLNCDSTYFQWHVPDGMRILSDSINVTEITVVAVDTPGGFIFITFETVNSGTDSCSTGECYSADGQCGTIKPLWVDIDYNYETEFAVICEWDCYFFCDEWICRPPGVYTFTCPIECGIRELTLFVEPFEQYVEFATVCPGECYWFFGQNYCQPGNYTVQNGFCAQYELILDESPAIQASASQTDASCNGSADGSISIYASGGSSLSYSLDGIASSSNPVFNGLSAGSYQVVITDQNGCTEEINVAVSEPSAISLSSLATDVSCYGGSDGTVTIIASGGTPPFNYSYNGGPYTGNTLFNGLTAGVHVFTIVDDSGCENSLPLNISEPPQIETFLSQSICEGQSVSVGNSTYTATGVFVNNLTAASGCDSIVTLQLEVILNDTIVNGLIELCEGECYVLGGDDYCEKGSYAISFPGNGSCMEVYLFELSYYSSSGPVVSNLQVACGSSNNDYTVSFDLIDGVPPFSVNGQLITGGYSFSSLIAGSNSYSFEITDSDLCPKTIMVEGSSPIFQTEAGEDGELYCDQSEIELIAEGGALNNNLSFQWITSDGSILSDPEELSILVNAPGMYIFSVLDNNSGCNAFDTVYVTGSSEPPSVELGEDQFLLLGDSLFLEASTTIVPNKINWYIDGQLIAENTGMQLSWFPMKSSEFGITLEDEYGCIAEDKINVVLDRRSKIYIPNVFSPNGDKLNDRFTVYTDPSVTNVITMQIFSRWGDLVYTGSNFPPNDSHYGWDGFHRGTTLNNAVFVYLVELEFLDGSRKKYTGDITLLR